MCTKLSPNNYYTATCGSFEKILWYLIAAPEQRSGRVGMGGVGPFQWPAIEVHSEPEKFQMQNHACWFTIHAHISPGRCAILKNVSTCHYVSRKHHQSANYWGGIASNKQLLRIRGPKFMSTYNKVDVVGPTTGRTCQVVISDVWCRFRNRHQYRRSIDKKLSYHKLGC